VREPGFDVTQRVVPEVAGESPAEARQSRQGCRAKSRQERLDERQRIAIMELDNPGVILDSGVAFAHAQAHVGRQADERIAPEPLAADHGFEQERIALASQLEMERQRGVEVRKRLEHERNAVVALRREGAEFGFGDHASTFLLNHSSTGASLWLFARDAGREGSGGALPAPLALAQVEVEVHVFDYSMAKADRICAIVAA
jgi:hypothetical protein